MPAPKLSAQNHCFPIPPGYDSLGYCDGACKGNPGPGGWGVAWQHRDSEFATLALGGPNVLTTNNRMELQAAIELIGLTEARERVLVRTDSQYVIKGCTEWRRGWQAKGMRNSKGDAVANPELWEQLWSLVDVRQVRFEWVKGHTGDVGNELADELATLAIRPC